MSYSYYGQQQPPPPPTRQQPSDPRVVCRQSAVTAPRSYPEQPWPQPCMRITAGPPTEPTSPCIDRYRPYQQYPPPPPTMGYEPCGTIGMAAYEDRSPRYGPCGPIPPPKPLWPPPCELPKLPCKKPPPTEGEDKLAEGAEPKEGEKPKEEGEAEPVPEEGNGGEAEEGAAEGEAAEGEAAEGEEAEKPPGEPAAEEKPPCVPPTEEPKAPCRYRPTRPLAHPSRDAITGYIPPEQHPPLPKPRVCPQIDPRREILPLPFDPETSVPIQLARKICLAEQAEEKQVSVEEVYCPPEVPIADGAEVLGDFRAEVTIHEVFMPRPPPGYPPFPEVDCCREYHQMESVPVPIVYSPCYLQYVEQGYTRDR